MITTSLQKYTPLMTDHAAGTISLHRAHSGFGHRIYIYLLVARYTLVLHASMQELCPGGRIFLGARCHFDENACPVDMY